MQLTGQECQTLERRLPDFLRSLSATNDGGKWPFKGAVVHHVVITTY